MTNYYYIVSTLMSKAGYFEIVKPRDVYWHFSRFRKDEYRNQIAII